MSKNSQIWLLIVGLLAISAVTFWFIGRPASEQATHKDVNAAPVPLPETPAIRAEVAERAADLDTLIADLYGIISGPAGPRDWARFRALSRPEAQFNSFVPQAEGEAIYQPLDLESYIRQAGDQIREYGFYETEIAREVDRYNHIAHVFSTFEARRQPGGPVLFRGINSIQCLFDGERWWIVNILWDIETRRRPIPPAYLPDN